MSNEMTIPPMGPAVSLIDVSTCLPGDPTSAGYYSPFAGADELRDSLMFRAPKFRRHVGEDETAIDMVERAAAGLIDRHGQAGAAAIRWGGRN
jgi:3-oxoacyl-[acyl-carrier-protein] synthase III